MFVFTKIDFCIGGLLLGMQCKKEENLQNCSCSYPDCPRKGMCCECVAHHRIKNQIPACFFPADVEMETMNDRSIENFIKSWEK